MVALLKLSHQDVCGANSLVLWQSILWPSLLKQTADLPQKRKSHAAVQVSALPPKADTLALSENIGSNVSNGAVGPAPPKRYRDTPFDVAEFSVRRIPRAPLGSAAPFRAVIHLLLKRHVGVHSRPDRSFALARNLMHQKRWSRS